MKFLNIKQFSLLKNKLGPILLQLPPQLTFDRSRVENFFKCLKLHHHGYRFALEGRHLSWFEDEALQLMDDYDIALVMSDYSQPPDWQAITSDFIYLRFHGAEQLYSSKYSPQYLKKVATKIKFWLKSGKVVWVFFNNDADAYAIDNALKLKKYLASPNPK